MMTAAVEFLALGAIGILAYTYVIFPLLVFALAKLLPKPWVRGESTPRVDVIMICHNEATHIQQKLRNLLSLDDPADSLNVIVASDGSDDDTEELVAAIADPRVQLLAFPRRGKIPALNDAVAAATGEILVFSDANSMFEPESLQNLVRHFEDSRIGCVAGNQVYLKNSNAGVAAAGEHSYWNFDRALKQAESQFGNAISATGAIYAIRRELFQPVPSGVTDDFTVSTRVIQQGFRMVFDAEAIASEEVAGKPRAEFRRKIRVMTRGFRSIWTVRGLMNPFKHGFYSIQLISHKLLRRLSFVPLIVLMLSIPWMWSWGGLSQVLAASQIAAYGLAVIGLFLSKTRLGKWKLFAIPYYVCLVNVAALVACFNVVVGRKIERWDSQRSDAECDSIPQASLINS